MPLDALRTLLVPDVRVTSLEGLFKPLVTAGIAFEPVAVDCDRWVLFLYRARTARKDWLSNCF